MLSLIASIPSPENGSLGPIRLYGLFIAVGVVAATMIADRRWRARGGEKETMGDIAFVLVMCGVVGARLYHVITDYEAYTEDPIRALKIWEGGLSIWGAVLGGAVGLWFISRKRKLPGMPLSDCLLPAVLIAQAIGRWGNYANQELFGKPLDAPWALEIAVEHRPADYVQYTTFHPTFLYESLWCLLIFAVITLILERRASWKVGQTTFAYMALYTLGRFLFENLRIDSARKIGPLRVNAWVSLLIFTIGVVGLIVAGRRGETWASRSERMSKADESAEPVPVTSGITETKEAE